MAKMNDVAVERLERAMVTVDTVRRLARNYEAVTRTVSVQGAIIHRAPSTTTRVYWVRRPKMTKAPAPKTP